MQIDCRLRIEAGWKDQDDAALCVILLFNILQAAVKAW